MKLFKTPILLLLCAVVLLSACLAGCDKKEPNFPVALSDTTRSAIELNTEIRKDSDLEKIYQDMLDGATVKQLNDANEIKCLRKDDDGYRVIYTKTQEDTVSADYCSVEDSILRYGTDGASLMDRNGEILWDVSYSMSEPDVALRGRTIAIYDTAGSDIVICDKTGQIGTASANRPVVKAEVSSSGNVAAIEEDSANAYIEYYALNGKQIAEIKTSLDNPGYPLDLALSEDGNLIAVSYLSVSGGQQQTSVRIYSFGSAGQSQMDNQIGEFDYTGKIIPELGYLEGSDLLAFSDDGFTLFSGSTVPKEGKTVTVTGDIRSAFCDEAHIGLITEADEGYTLHVYNADGRQSLEKDFDYSYQTMDYTDGEVTLYNNSAFCVYSLSGVLKFDGSYKGSVSFIFSLGRHRYGVVREGGMDLIQLG